MTERRDPGGKFTVFDLLSLVGAMIGAYLGVAFGVWIGSRYGALAGWSAGIPACAAGFWIGAIPGQMIGDWGIMSLFRELNAMDTEALRRRLAEQYYVSHLAMMILLQRGENRAELGLEALQMLRAESSDVRFFGRRTLHMNFPELVPVLEQIDPLQPPEMYADKIAEMERLVTAPPR